MATEHPRHNHSIYEQMVDFVVEGTGQPRDKVREMLPSQKEIECQLKTDTDLQADIIKHKEEIQLWIEELLQQGSLTLSVAKQQALKEFDILMLKCVHTEYMLLLEVKQAVSKFSTEVAEQQTTEI
ncbi:hypothetical protein Moror_8799 [Moniliophthora roreri MCA 2997]|uniref:Uncharacterized protein n=1 Tax=Moniliophthora roreri (strain MCA 2997) TaxID=1381753 RepID=V2WRZ8_MONRO|nr:hypothetical protein Moror_8799 [Moniliophthora roreri MCA 2997]